MQPIRVWNSAMPSNHYGTAGCLVRSGDRVGLLTASHVIVPVCYGVSVGAHGSVSFLVDSQVNNGTLSNWSVPMTSSGVPITTSCDAAFAIVDSTTEQKLIDIMGLPAGIKSAETYGEKAYFIGATSGKRKQTVIHDISGRVSMRFRLYENDNSFNYSTIQVPMFGLIQCDAKEPVEPGDSGCLLFDSDGYALGLLVGTDQNDIYPYFTHIKPILKLFGLQLITSMDHPHAARLIDSF